MDPVIGFTSISSIISNLLRPISIVEFVNSRRSMDPDLKQKYGLGSDVDVDIGISVENLMCR